MSDITIRSASGYPIKLKDMGDGTYAEVVAVDGATSGGGSVAANWSTTYAYSGSQITSETRTDGTVTQTRAYGYDASGNLTSIGAWA